MPDTTRPLFDSYSLPVQRRRQGPAAALSFAAHLAIAILVLWRGAELFEGGGGSGTGGGPRGGGGGGGRPAVSWCGLPTPASPIPPPTPPAPGRAARRARQAPRGPLLGYGGGSSHQGRGDSAHQGLGLPARVHGTDDGLSVQTSHDA